VERWVGRDGEGLVRVGDKEWRGIGLKAKKKKWESQIESGE
jgi:hypothetical protein